MMEIESMVLNMPEKCSTTRSKPFLINYMGPQSPTYYVHWISAGNISGYRAKETWVQKETMFVL